MTDFSKQIGASIDDGSVNDMPSWLPTNTTAVIGASASYSYDDWFRFTSVTIPAGATIVSAIVRFFSGPSQSATICNVNLYFENADSAPAPGTRTDLLGRPLTSAVAWNNLPAWTLDSTYDTPDLSSILQDVIDRGGWSSGNALMLHVRNNSSTAGAYRAIITFDAYTGKSAELIVSYTEANQISKSETIILSEFANAALEFKGEVAGVQNLSITENLEVGLDKLLNEGDDLAVIENFAVALQQLLEPIEPNILEGVAVTENAGVTLHDPGLKVSYSANLTSGQTVSGKTELYAATNAIDGDTDTSWIADEQNLSWLKIQFSQEREIRKLRILFGNDANITSGDMPKDFTLQGSNTGNFSGEEITVLTVSNYTGWSQNVWSVWQIDYQYADSFLYYRINITATVAGGGYPSLSDVEMMEFLPIFDAVGISENVTVAPPAIAPPTGTGADDIAIVETVNIELALEIDKSELIAISEFATLPIFAETAETMQIDDSITAFNWSKWFAANKNKAIPRYYCTLTGAADATTDVQIPISSLQARKRNGEPTFLSVVVPGFAYAQEITDRANGEIIITIGYEINGTIEFSEEILRATLEEIRIDEGPTNRAISLSGNKTQTFSTQIATVENSIYRSIQGNNIVHRFAQIDPFLNPGDTCRTGADEFTVDYIIYMVNSYGATMEVREG